MHGSIRQLLCPVCGLVIPMNDFLSQQLRRRTTIPCTACSCPALRSRIMLYGDAEGEGTHPIPSLSLPLSPSPATPCFHSLFAPEVPFFCLDVYQEGSLTNKCIF